MDDYERQYFEETGGVPFDHWGKGCRYDCLIPEHAAHQVELLKQWSEAFQAANDDTPDYLMPVVPYPPNKSDK